MPWSHSEGFLGGVQACEGLGSSQNLENSAGSIGQVPLLNGTHLGMAIGCSEVGDSCVNDQSVGKGGRGL